MELENISKTLVLLPNGPLTQLGFPVLPLSHGQDHPILGEVLHHLLLSLQIEAEHRLVYTA